MDNLGAKMSILLNLPGNVIMKVEKKLGSLAYLTYKVG